MTGWRIETIAAAVLGLITIASAAARTEAQSQTTPCQSSGTTPCATTRTTNSVSQQFPYPGEAKDARSDEGARAPDAKPTKDQFPYPVEKASDPAPKGESSSSADSPAVAPDDKPELKDAGSSGSTRARRRLRPPAQKILSDDERVEEDLSVARFYQQSGNLNGAYLRAKDAVKLQPQTADGHLALAEIAQKMGKRDEAVAEYTKYLELDPDGEAVKAARKSLEKLKP